MTPDDFHRRVLHTIARWNMLPPDTRIGVALSGGADSTALFRILHALSGERRWTIVALHVNHKLRGLESDGDEGFVRALAGFHGVLCEVASLPLPANGNPEQEARRLRYDWFLRRAGGTAPHEIVLQKIAIGHTRSDQAETVLFRFLRGSGTGGLAGIRPILPNGVVRPLIESTREAVRDYLRFLGQPWREDASNRSLRFDRNRIRLHLLPQLTREWNPALEATLANTAQWAWGEEEYWENLVDRLARDHFTAAPGPAIVCRADALRALPVAASRRLIREAVRRVAGSLLSIDFAHVENIRSLLAEHEGSGRLQIPALDVMRSFDWVRFALPGAYGGERHISVPMPLPGVVEFPFGSSLSLKVETADYRYNESVNCIDADRISPALVLRTWQPGDQYRPVGRACAIKLKTLFQESRIPLWERRTWPVLVMNSGEPAGETIVWTRRFGSASEVSANAGTQRCVMVSEHLTGENIPASSKLESEPGVRRL